MADVTTMRTAALAKRQCSRYRWLMYEYLQGDVTQRWQIAVSSLESHSLANERFDILISEIVEDIGTDVVLIFNIPK